MKELIITLLLFSTVLGNAHPPRPRPKLPSLSQQYLNVAAYPFSKIVGVFRIVDGDSCRCTPRSRPCPVEIMEDSVFKERGFPCPFLTRYCCQRETLIDMSGAIDRTLKSTDHQNRNSTASDVDRTRPTHLVASNSRISTEKSNNNRIQAVSQSTDVSKSPFSNVPSVSEVSSVLNVTQVSVVPDASETSTVTLTQSIVENKASGNSGRRAKPKACSCTTRDQCLAWWSELDDAPEVKVRTSLRCEEPSQVTCCFGRIVPSLHHISRDPTHSGHDVRQPFMTRWRPLANAWQNIISWFNG
ncbi:uncharacterized protein LOC125038751 [Penaeus chinensis]|uniref:uncharacterized protein LOC125038751 n=1 Tax=Penaeus chinensis TaxID=139456 RepID=UPI001FB73B84|nr:uncharacterized protein LOC125038751 [Penaeus chinensis]